MTSSASASRAKTLSSSKKWQQNMGLKISTIAVIPQNVERSYYLYILDYYNWDEPIGSTLLNGFDKIAKIRSSK